MCGDLSIVSFKTHACTVAPTSGSREVGGVRAHRVIYFIIITIVVDVVVVISSKHGRRGASLMRLESARRSEVKAVMAPRLSARLLPGVIPRAATLDY
eukprot:545402-Prorocentrum_minimum.AAC.1